MTKIIFLDIDGVLLPFRKTHPAPSFEQEHELEIHLPPEHIELVNRLAKENNAEIVISSSWRLHDDSLVFNKKNIKDYKPFDLRKFLRKSGLTSPLAEDWHTPRGERFSEIINGLPRGVEINRWLQEHSEVIDWVALDDDSNGFRDLGIRNHLVKTEPYAGFKEEDYNIANTILKGIKDVK